MNQDLLDKISAASLNKTEMRELADGCKDLPEQDYTEMLQYLLSIYDGPGVTNLLTISAINKIKLDPETFVKSIMMCDDRPVVLSCSDYQTEDVVTYLLDYGYKWHGGASNKTVTAFYIAIDLIKKHKLDEEKRKIIDLINFMHFNSEDAEAIADFVYLKRCVKSTLDRKSLEILNKLPERNYRIYLPTNKRVGNEAWKLGHIDPAVLSNDELMDKSEDAAIFGFKEKCLEFSKEISKRMIKISFSSFRYLFDYGILYNDLELVNSLCYEKVYGYKEVTNELLKGLSYANEIIETELKNDTGTDMFMIFKRIALLKYPGLDIILTRAMRVACQNEAAIDQGIKNIKGSRILIGLDPTNDPVFEFASYLKNKEHYLKLEQSCESLNTQVLQTKDELKQIKIKLDKKSKTNEQLIQQNDALKKQVHGDKQLQDIAKERDELKYQVDCLKMKAKSYSKAITDLKSKNEALQARIDDFELVSDEKESELVENASAEEELTDEISRPPKEFNYPVFEKEFYQNMNELDGGMKSKAWYAANGFATNRGHIWNKTRQLKTLKDHYRIKIDQNYRIILQWKNGDPMRFLAVITRQELESWIRNKL